MERPLPIPIPPRNLQQVFTLAIRRTITARMVEDVTLYGEGGLNGRVIQAFSVLPTLSKQVDGGNKATNSKPMWTLSINFLVAGAGLANGSAIF